MFYLYLGYIIIYLKKKLLNFIVIYIKMLFGMLYGVLFFIYIF